MDVITADPRVEEVTVMKSVRTGGTQAAIDNPIGYFIHNDPGPMLVVQPGKTEARDWSKRHFDNMVRDTPVLRNLVNSDRIKDRKNEILVKEGPGWVLYIIGAVSAAGFRGKTVQRVFLDDVDAYDVSVGGEGDPIALARNRTLSYALHRRMIVKVSSPTTRGLSRIATEFAKSSQEHFYCFCPFCRHLQYLAFSPRSEYAHLSGSFLRFDSANVSWVHYECENCKKPIPEKYKLQLITGGKWVAQKPQEVTHIGFQFSEMVSTFTSWEILARDFLEAKKSTETLRVFNNQRLAETFEENKNFDLNEDDLRKRVEDYVAVPIGVLVLTASVDVQHDRLEVMVLGWGKGEENWFIEHRRIIGSPERLSTWRELDEYLEKPWRHESGLELKLWSTHGLNAVAVDSSDSTDEVYQYVRRHLDRRFWAIKGRAGANLSFINDVKYEKRFGARFATISVDALKVRLFDRLGIQQLPDKSWPPGRMHFNEKCTLDFFEQLTAEKRIIIRDKRSGYSKWKWVLKTGRRNEILDLYVYNYAALALLDPDLDNLAMQMEERITELKAKGDQGPQDDPDGPKPPRPKVARSSYLDRWR